MVTLFFGFLLVSSVFGVMTVQQSLPLNQGDVAKEKNLKTDALKLPRQGRVSTSGQYPESSNTSLFLPLSSLDSNLRAHLWERVSHFYKWRIEAGMKNKHGSQIFFRSQKFRYGVRQLSLSQATTRHD